MLSSTPRLPTMDFAADLAESLEVLREHEPAEGYYGLFSGGKDSVALRHLAKMAGVKVAWHYNVTIDPPELVRFMREHYPDTTWRRSPHGPFFRRAAEVKGFPMVRPWRNRWCCDEYKEQGSPRGVTLLMGVRGEESASRAAGWDVVGEFRKTKTKTVAPLYRWPSDDLWDFIRGESVPYCSLYDEGFKRLGCVGCPMPGADARRAEFARWPRFEQRWQYVIKRTWERRSGTTQRDGQPWFGSAYFKDWRGLWEWWRDGCRGLPAPKDPCGMSAGPSEQNQGGAR